MSLKCSDPTGLVPVVKEVEWGGCTSPTSTFASTGTRPVGGVNLPLVFTLIFTFVWQLVLSPSGVQGGYRPLRCPACLATRA